MKDYSKVDTNELLKILQTKADEFLQAKLNKGDRILSKELMDETEAIQKELQSRNIEPPSLDDILDSMKKMPTEELVIKYSLTKAKAEAMGVIGRDPELKKLLEGAEAELKDRNIDPTTIQALTIGEDNEPQKIFEEKKPEPKAVYDKTKITKMKLKGKLTFHKLMNMNEARLAKEGEVK